MTEPTILIYHRELADAYATELRAHGLAGVDAVYNPEDASRLISECDILFGWKVPQGLLRGAKRLRWIQSMGAGVDDLVSRDDIPSDVAITRIVGQFGEPIAEYVFSRLLYVFKDLGKSLEAQRKHVWAPVIEGTLAGKVIGIAGLGSIGCDVAALAKAFKMTVLGLSRSRVGGCTAVDEYYSPADWGKFASKVDILVLTLPLTEETHHVINGEVFKRMKTNSWIVNVGRGQLIDETALAETLRLGEIGGAILDVFESEPLPPTHPFWSHENVIVTPHLSGPSRVESVTEFFVENLARFKSGDELLGLVNLKIGY